MHGSVLIKSEKNENELCGMTLYIGFTNEPAKLTLKKYQDTPGCNTGVQLGKSVLCNI